MKRVKPKKHLGQHFLADRGIAKKIAASLAGQPQSPVLEIGAGTGVLTQFLVSEYKLFVVEVDAESVAVLKEKFPQLGEKILHADFLKLDLERSFSTEISIIGNFPYNISSQILFRVLQYRTKVPELVGMFQREVAQRIAAEPGSKAYGILSVLVQAFFRVDYLFSVSPNVFVPPPKVKSGVIRLTRLEETSFPCGESLFFTVVKTAFNQRRKTMRNSLKGLLKGKTHTLLSKRPEQISIQDFITLTQLIEARQ